MNFIDHIQNFNDETLEELPARKQARITQIGVLGGVLAHIIWLTFFLSVQEYSVVLINLGCIAFFLYLFYLTKTKQFASAIALMIVQVVIFSLYMTHLLGHESKFYYFLLLLFMLPYFLRKPNYILHTSISVIGVVAYVVAVLNPEHFSDASIVLDAQPLYLIGAANMVQTFSMIVAIIYADNHYTYEGSKQLLLQKTYSDFLLEKILPKYIIDKIRHGDKEVVSEVPIASIVFLDVVGFTALSATKKPKEILELLNAFFSMCDGLALKYKIDKIKTIGDAYMAASGVSTHDGGKEEAVKIIGFALEVIDTVVAQGTSPDCCDISVRIGVNSGFVMAGIIGEQRMAFDLWGHAVNVAARIESAGGTNCVTVSESTYELVKDEFALKEVREVNLKGIGESKVYILAHKS